MDTTDKEKLEVEKRNGDNNVDYESVNTPADWRFCGSNSTGLFPSKNPISACPSSCSPSHMVDSFGQAAWRDPTNVQTLGFCGFNVQSNLGSSNTMAIGNGDLPSLRNVIDRPLEMGWNLPNLLPRGNGLFLPNATGFLPHSVAQFPADSGFIERAARFSLFSGGNFGDMMNHPLGIAEPIGLHSQGGGTMQGLQDLQAGSGSKLAHEGHSTRNEFNVSESLKGATLAVKHGFKNEAGIVAHIRSNEETKLDAPGSSNPSDEAQSSGGNGQNELSGGETTSKGFNTKKRKRLGQDSEPDQSHRAQQSGEETDNNGNNRHKDEQNPNSPSHKTNGGKQGKQASDPLKEGYVHVRARRGQATNSHSLAERVRREKISERMKFLQDLVPGCNKVTGKAVMLDEIINYVQSLQRQVEFLSMKLATVNPRLDFDIENLLAKDALQLRPGPSSAPPFPQNMPMAFPPLPHLSQPGFMQAALAGIGNTSDVLRRTIGSQLQPMDGGFKQQETHGWEGDLQNVVHMSHGTGVPADNNQEATESLPSANMKMEA